MSKIELLNQLLDTLDCASILSGHRHRGVLSRMNGGGYHHGLKWVEMDDGDFQLVTKINSNLDYSKLS